MFTLQGMTGIPSQPIGYGDAKRLLELIGGPEVPAAWRGRLPGLTYRLGPGFDTQHRSASSQSWATIVATVVACAQL